MNINEILFCIFSYNRGVYLNGCVNSLIKHCPNLNKENIIIYDDTSDEPNTIKVLNELKKDIKIITGKEQNKAISRAGLYNNMNLAFSYAKNKGYRYAFFIQEDLQVVRDIDDTFIKECEDIFNSNEKIVEIQPIFFKGTIKEAEYKKIIKIDADNKYYYGNINNLLGVVDIGLINVERLAKYDWFFDDEEVINMKKGTELGIMYVKTKDPIMMYTPWPETYRYRKSSKDSLFLKFLDKYYKTGYHSYESMSRKNVEKLKSRDINIYPIAENFLRIEGNTSLKKPWNFVSVKFYSRKKFFNLIKKLHLFWIVEYYYFYKKRKRKNNK